MDHSMAPSDVILHTLRLANEVTRAHGFGYIVDPKVIELWDALNGRGVVFQAFEGLAGGGYLGTIDDLKTMTGREINPCLSASEAFGTTKLEFVLATDHTDLSPLGLPNGSGIAFGVGPGLGANAEVRNTLAIPLVGKNRVLLSIQNPHSVRETFANIMDAAGYAPPDIENFMAENPDLAGDARANWIGGDE